MCKLFAIVEIENQKNGEQFAKYAVPLITATDNHGLGIMRMGENGVHAVRWLDPSKPLREKKSKALRKYEKALKHQQNETGIPSRRLDAIAIHGRFATCEKTMENTHPFNKDGTYLMHNGVITNPEKFERTLSTCDSEVLLSQYLLHDIKNDNKRLTEALKDVQGYYAAIVFNDNGTIDIWRDSIATLFIAHVRGVGVVIATTKEIIIGSAKKCKAYITGLDEILPNTVIRWKRGLYPTLGTFEKVITALPVTTTHGDYVAPGWDYRLDEKDSDKWWTKENWKDKEQTDIPSWEKDLEQQDKQSRVDELVKEIEEEQEKRELERLYDQNLERRAIP